MNAVTWFEIPVQDIDRAADFYEKLLQIKMHRELFENIPNALFPREDGVGGSLAEIPYSSPSTQGAVVYLNVPSMEILDSALAQIETLGGKVLMPKTDIGRPGHIALIRDTEGNQIGLNVPAGA